MLPRGLHCALFAASLSLAIAPHALDAGGTISLEHTISAPRHDGSPPPLVFELEDSDDDGLDAPATVDGGWDGLVPLVHNVRDVVWDFSPMGRQRSALRSARGPPVG